MHSSMLLRYMQYYTYICIPYMYILSFTHIYCTFNTHIYSILNYIYTYIHIYLYTGDFVDRGSFSFENVFTLLCIKLVSNNSLTMLRGNHETKNMNMM